jgi:sugar/nucleoside kinase (ribokinase family)
LGADVVLSGNPLGRDERAEEILTISQARGVTPQLTFIEGLRTAFCRCRVDENTGERDFVLSHEDIRRTENDHFDVIVSDVNHGRYSHLFVQPYLREQCQKLLPLIQEAPAWILAQDLKTDSIYLPWIDALQVSLEDLEIPFRKEALEELGSRYFNKRLKELFVTAGAEGVAYLKEGEPAQIFAGQKAKQVVDTTGCGDAFRAGLMFGLASGFEIAKAIQLGQELGAYKAQVRGSCLLEPLQL